MWYVLFWQFSHLGMSRLRSSNCSTHVTTEADFLFNPSSRGCQQLNNFLVRSFLNYKTDKWLLQRTQNVKKKKSKPSGNIKYLLLELEESSSLDSRRNSDNLDYRDINHASPNFLITCLNLPSLTSPLYLRRSSLPWEPTSTRKPTIFKLHCQTQPTLSRLGENYAVARWPDYSCQARVHRRWNTRWVLVGLRPHKYSHGRHGAAVESRQIYQGRTKRLGVGKGCCASVDGSSLSYLPPPPLSWL